MQQPINEGQDDEKFNLLGSTAGSHIPYISALAVYADSGPSLDRRNTYTVFLRLSDTSLECQVTVLSTYISITRHKVLDQSRQYERMVLQCRNDAVAYMKF